MKIGILLTGISYGDRFRDWKNTKHFINESVINCWGDSKPYIYLSTYDKWGIDPWHYRENQSIKNHPSMEELLEFYKPKKYAISDYDTRHFYKTYLNGLNLMVNEELDFIITTRFDIEFFKPLSSYPVDFNKFNILFREYGTWDKYEFTCDNLFMFPSKYLSVFMESVTKFIATPFETSTGVSETLHPLYRTLYPEVGKDNFNFLVEELQLSHANKEYRLHRI